jgi:hypothetical protein
VPNQATALAFDQDMVSRLARFFPEATRVRIPAKLSRTLAGEYDDSATETTAIEPKNGAEHVFLQDTVIEFGTTNEVLFVVDRPLEFADRVLLESRDGSFRAEASVVAVQYHTEHTVIAARFLKPVPNWIVKS